jgi:Ca-activated chloride channel family protein
LRRQEKAFFTWVKDHWFYDRSLSSKVGSLSFLLGVVLLMLALLDLRGPEEKIEGKVSDQKTILLIDSSMSMLAEDVRPNRFKKAVVLAKHFVKRAVGQQVSIVVFSDSAKQIMPFTNDIDLLEARLGALDNMNLSRGGTSLTLGIKESIQFFKNHTKNPSGNILIFTDAEETDGGIDAEIPEGISIGIVGVGTAKGAVIPMRTKNGAFVGNKRFKGKAVVTKLDEKFIKSLGEKIKEFRYWIATSYTLPTQEIIDFFTNLHNTKQSKNSFRIRPVLSNFLMIPGILLLLISFLLKMKNSFVLPMLLFLSISGLAQDKEEEPKEKSETVKILEEKFIKGKITNNEKKALASQLLQEGFAKEAEALYEEIVSEEIDKESLTDHFNRGAAQFKNKKIVEGFNSYKKLYDHLKENDPESKLLPTVKANMLKALEQMASQSKSKSGKSDDDQDKNDDEKDKDSDSNSEDKKDGKDNKKSGKNEQSKNGKEQDEENKKDNKNQDEKNKDKKDKKNQGEKNKDNETKKDKNKQSDKKGDPSGGKPKGKKKLPAILKQLMSDDNQLQQKMIDTGTTKPKTREKKDW